MAWLRIDDGFTKHPKFAGWTAAQRWAWLEVMEYCARYQTGGIIPDDLSLMPRTTTPSLLRKASESGWIEATTDGSSRIRNWNRYNPKDPTAAERQAKRRAKTTENVTEMSQPSHGDDRDENVTSRAGTRGTRPVPSPLDIETSLQDAREISNERGQGWVDNLNAYTGCRLVRGSHAFNHTHDILGTEPPPHDWPHPRPTRHQILAELKRRKEPDAGHAGMGANVDVAQIHTEPA